ncbi:hypothetical protein H9P43_002191 [Blastocladiella emersonii ATCC 22665]|nr:hypothetical protein H9P43_002191 [Blastocladiella emersonii ATCC 22665]
MAPPPPPHSNGHGHGHAASPDAGHSQQHNQSFSSMPYDAQIRAGLDMIHDAVDGHVRELEGEVSHWRQEAQSLSRENEQLRRALTESRQRGDALAAESHTLRESKQALAQKYVALKKYAAQLDGLRRTVIHMFGSTPGATDLAAVVGDASLAAIEAAGPISPMSPATAAGAAGGGNGRRRESRGSVSSILSGISALGNQQLQQQRAEEESMALPSFAALGGLAEGHTSIDPAPSVGVSMVHVDKHHTDDPATENQTSTAFYVPTSAAAAAAAAAISRAEQQQQQQQQQKQQKPRQDASRSRRSKTSHHEDVYDAPTAASEKPASRRREKTAPSATRSELSSAKPSHQHQQAAVNTTTTTTTTSTGGGNTTNRDAHQLYRTIRGAIPPEQFARFADTINRFNSNVLGIDETVGLLNEILADHRDLCAAMKGLIYRAVAEASFTRSGAPTGGGSTAAAKDGGDTTVEPRSTGTGTVRASTATGGRY